MLLKKRFLGRVGLHGYDVKLEDNVPYIKSTDCHKTA